MPNMINQAVSASYDEAFDQELDTLFVQPVGMSVEEVNAFRGKLGESQLHMTLLKGALAKRVLKSTGFENVDSFFEGPAAVITATSDEVEGVAITASRVVQAWRKETGNELPAVKGGVMDGEVLDADGASALAKLPTKADLQSMLVGQILGPGRSLAGQLQGMGGKLAGQLKTLIDNLGGGEEA